MSEACDNAKLFELAREEILVPLKVTHAGHTYRVSHCLRPPAPADWYAYEAALEPAVEELPPDAAGGEPSYRLALRASDAALELWTRLIRRVQGSALPQASGHDSCPEPSRRVSPAETSSGHGFSECSGDPELVEGSRAEDSVANDGALAPEVGWCQLIPLAHKEASVRALTLVAPARPDAVAAPNGFFPLAAEEVRVTLEAAAGGAAYPRLVHRFRAPSVEAERRYRRLLADNFIVRGSRAPRTLLPPRLPALVRLYDQLILGVEGYALNGQALCAAEPIVQHMDAWHKRVAVEALFGTPAPDTPAAEPSE